MGALRDAERGRDPAPPGRASCSTGRSAPSSCRRARTRSPAPCRPRPTASTSSCAAPGRRSTAVEPPGDGGGRAGGRDPAGRAREGEAGGEAARRRGRAAGAARRPRARGRFSARVSLEELGKAGPPPDDEIRPDRDEGVCGSSPRRSAAAAGCPCSCPTRLAGAVARRDGTELALTRTRQGDAALVERTPRAVVETAAWSARRARWRSRARSRSTATPRSCCGCATASRSTRCRCAARRGRFARDADARGDRVDGGDAAAARGHVAAVPARGRAGRTRR